MQANNTSNKYHIFIIVERLKMNVKAVSSSSKYLILLYNEMWEERVEEKVKEWNGVNLSFLALDGDNEIILLSYRINEVSTE